MHITVFPQAIVTRWLSMTSFCQCAVIEFLVKESNAAAYIYGRLRRVYEDACMDASSIRRWVKRFKDGDRDITDEPRCGQLRSATTEYNKHKVDVLISED